MLLTTTLWGSAMEHHVVTAAWAGISSKQANKGAFSPHHTAVDGGVHWTSPSWT